MNYRPWPLNERGSYNEKAVAEQTDIYCCSGEAVRETLLYFEERGGNTSAVLSLLNGHVIGNDYQITREELLDPARFYTHEYYFYFIMFCKKVIGRYDFHFGENRGELLSPCHLLYERGFLAYPPWKIGETGAEGDNSITNLKALLSYTEKERNIDSGIIVDFLNACAPPEYRIDKEFLLQETFMVSVEYALYCLLFTKVIVNDDLVLRDAFQYSLVKNIREIRLLFALPHRIALQTVIALTERNNKLWERHISLKRGELLVDGTQHPDFDAGKYSIFRRSCFRMSLSAFSWGCRAFVKLIYGVDSVSEQIYVKEENPFRFRIKLNWKHPRNFLFLKLPAAAVLSAAAVSSIFFLKNSEPALFIIYTSGLGALGGGLVSWLAESRKKSRIRLEDRNKQYEEQYKELEKIARDLMEEKLLLEEKVRARTKELEEKDKMKTALFANISHELRTPISLIKTPVEAVLQGEYGKDIKHDAEVFTLIHKNSMKLLSTVDNLLLATKLDSSSITAHRSRFSITSLLKTIIAELSYLAAKKKIEITFDNKGREFLVQADMNHFHIIFSNLLSNALKFTRKKGIVHVDVENDPSAKQISVTVSDTGIGIAEEKLDKVFERFYQVDYGSWRSEGGIGLGLSFVKELVQLNGGSITLTSNEGKGSSFTVRLPGETAAESASVSPERPETTMAPGNSPAVKAEITTKETDRPALLILEDNEDLLTFLKEMLSSEYEVYTAVNGKDGMNLLFSVPAADLIIADIMMPEMDGKAFFNHVQTLPRYRTVPFIFLTARSGKEEKLESLQSGAVEYIYKPFDLDELRTKIRNILKRENLIREDTAKRIGEAAKSVLKPNSPGSCANETPLESGTISLSRREKEIAELVRAGNTDKEIAFRLGISAKTVSNTLAHIYQKLDISGRVELAMKLSPGYPLSPRGETDRIV